MAWERKGRLASCSRDKNIWVWALEGEEYVCDSVLSGHTQDVKYVCWASHRPHLVSCSYDNEVRIWVQEGDDFTCNQVLSVHESTVWSCCLSQDDFLLVTVSDDRAVALFRLSPDGKYVLVEKVDEAHESVIYSCCFLGGRLVTGSGDGDLAVW